MAFTALVVPLWKLLRYLAPSPRLAQHRSRSVLISLGLLLLPLGGLGGVRVPGVVEALHHRQLCSESPRTWTPLSMACKAIGGDVAAAPAPCTAMPSTASRKRRGAS